MTYPNDCFIPIDNLWRNDVDNKLRAGHEGDVHFVEANVAQPTETTMGPIAECTIRVMRKGHGFILGAQSQNMIFAP